MGIPIWDDRDWGLWGRHRMERRGSRGGSELEEREREDTEKSQGEVPWLFCPFSSGTEGTGSGTDD
jgi:hypothetical protein